MENIITREIEFKLTEAEFSTKAHELAGFHAQITELEEELKGHKKRLGDQIKNFQKDISQICKEIETGTAIRSVECEFKKKFETNVVEYYHEGILVDERTMEAHERQQEMFNKKEMDIAEEVFKDTLN